MSASVLYMSMSLDGYIAGPNDEPDNPGGDGFDRLHEWGADGSRPPTPPAGELIDEWNATGAVLVGRRTAEQIDHWGGDHHGVPIFVPSHRPPGPSVANYPLVTYVTDGIASSAASAEHLRRLNERLGALVVGRRLYDMTNAWGGRHPLDLTTVVVTHQRPDDRPEDDENFVFVTTGIQDAVAKAREIADGKDVGVNGGEIARQCFDAGLLDEVHVDLVPVFLGSGIPLLGMI